MDLNVLSLVTVSRAFLPYLLRSKGKIANNISVAAYAALPCSGVYSASKAAANNLTESLRLELEPFGVRVIALVTGGVKSNIEANKMQQSLPEDLIYRVIPGGLCMMTGGTIISNGMDAQKWVEQVIGDFSKERPLHQIWRGSDATLVRVAALLPIGTMDGTIMKRTKFDEVGRALKQRQKTE